MSFKKVHCHYLSIYRFITVVIAFRWPSFIFLGSTTDPPVYSAYVFLLLFLQSSSVFPWASSPSLTIGKPFGDLPWQPFLLHFLNVFLPYQPSGSDIIYQCVWHLHHFPNRFIWFFPAFIVWLPFSTNPFQLPGATVLCLLLQQPDLTTICHKTFHNRVIHQLFVLFSNLPIP